jgi:hypothetical protein
VQAINGRRPTNTRRNEIGRVPSFRTKNKGDNPRGNGGLARTNWMFPFNPFTASQYIELFAKLSFDRLSGYAL